MAWSVSKKQYPQGKASKAQPSSIGFRRELRAAIPPRGMEEGGVGQRTSKEDRSVSFRADALENVRDGEHSEGGMGRVGGLMMGCDERSPVLTGILASRSRRRFWATRKGSASAAERTLKASCGPAREKSTSCTKV